MEVDGNRLHQQYEKGIFKEDTTMARIPMTSGFVIIPEGEYVFRIYDATYDEDFRSYRNQAGKRTGRNPHRAFLYQG